MICRKRSSHRVTWGIYQVISITDFGSHSQIVSGAGTGAAMSRSTHIMICVGSVCQRERSTVSIVS